MTKEDKKIVDILKKLVICWLCEGTGKVPDLDNNPKILINCCDCDGKGYYKKL